MTIMCLKGRGLGSVIYPGGSRIEKYQSSFFQDWPESFVELPWLNLLCYLSLYEARLGQPVSIGHYIVLRSIYDKEIEVFLKVKEQLREIFPGSFLFQEQQEPYQYCENYSDILTLERLKILSDQMIVFDFLDYFEADMPLSESTREVWLRTQMSKQHMTLDAFDRESSLPSEIYDRLTWFIPFNGFYPPDEKWTFNRYMAIV